MFISGQLTFILILDIKAEIDFNCHPQKLRVMIPI